MPITHNKSNIIPDFTGVVTVFGSNGSTETVNATDLVRPVDWNSAHNIAYNLSGNTLGSSQVSGNDVVLYGGNNITLSADTANSQLIIQAAGAGAGGSINFSAGTTSNNLASVIFSNSNGVSFGLNGSTITGSHNALTTQTVQTQGMVSVQGSTGDISFANSNGITFGGNASTITASHNGLTSQSNQAASAGNGSFTFQTLPFADSNGVSFSTGTQGVFATVKTDYLTSQSNQAISGSNGSLTFQTVTLGNLNGVSFYTSNGSVVASYTVPSTAGLISAVNVSAGTTSNNLSALTFSNGSNVSFGLNGSVITGSVATSLTNIKVSAGTTSNNLSALTFSDSNGVSFGLNGSVITATVATNYLTSQSNQAVSAANGSYAFQTLSFSNANGISFGTSAGSAVTASHNALTSQSNQALSGANGSFTFQTATFANSNGISFSTGTQGMYATVATNYAASDHSHGNPTLALTNLSGTTASASNGFTLSLSAGAGGAGDGVNILAAGTQTANTTGTVLFNNSNGITFGMSNSSVITASHNGITSQTNQTIGAYATSNTTQSSSGTIDARSLTFQGAGAASVGISNGSIIISAPNAAAGNVTFSAGTTSNGLADVVFSNSNGVSFGLNGSTITASVAAGGADGYNIVQLGTTGTTGTSWSSATATVQINGSNGITVSQNNSNQIVISGADVTLTRWIKGPNVTVIGNAGANSRQAVGLLRLENYVSCSQILLAGSAVVTTAANTSSAYHHVSVSAVLYTRNGSTLNSINSGSTNYSTLWQSNSTGSVVGPRAFPINLATATLLSPGDYWLAYQVSTTNSATGGANTTALNCNYQMLIAGSQGSAVLNIQRWGITNATSGGLYTGQGIFSANTGVTRASIAISDIDVNAQSGNIGNAWVELRNQSFLV